MTVASTQIAKILFADQHSDLMSIKTHLTDAGYAVTEATTLKSAQHQLNNTAYDIVVINHEWQNALPTLKTNQYLTLIIVDDDPQAIDSALTSGADDYITRPINPRLLQHRISKLLTQKSDDTPFRELFDVANDAIFVIDMESDRFILVNRQAHRLLGYSQDEFLAMNSLDILADDDDPKDDNVSSGHLLNSAGNMIFETLYIAKDGAQIPVEISSRVITYAGKKAVLNFARDIRQRKQIEQSEYEQRQLNEALQSISEILNSSLDLHEVIGNILDQVQHVVKMDTASLMLVDEEYVKILDYKEYREYEIRGTLDDFKWKYAEVKNLSWVIEYKLPLLIPDTHASEHWEFLNKNSHWIRSNICIPLIKDEVVVGILNLDSAQPDYFKSEDLNKLLAFANYANIALQNALLYQQIQTHAEDLEKRVNERTNELKQERNLLRTLINHLPAQIYIKDSHTRFLIANNAVAKILGVKSVNDLIGKTDFAFMPKEVAELHNQMELNIIETGKPLIDYEDTTQSNIYLRTTKIPLYDENNQVIGLVGINHDITQIKETERILQEERNLLKTLIETIPDSIYIKDTEGKFILANKASIISLGGNTLDDIKGKTDFDLLPQSIARTAKNSESNIISSGKPMVNKEYTFDDENWSLITKVPLHDDDGNIKGIIGINRDITHIKHTEQILETERNLLRIVIDNIPDYIYVKNTEGKYILANQAAVDNFKQSSIDNIISKTDFDLLPQSIAEVSHQDDLDIINNGEAIQNREFSPQDDTWLLISKLPLRDNNGDIIGVVGINRNISEIKQAEQALEAERTLLRTVIDNIPDNIYVKDLNHHFILANQATLTSHNAKTLDDIQGLSDTDFLPESTASDNKRIEKDIMTSGKPLFNREYLTADGRWLLISKTPLRDSENNVIGLVGINHNISNMKEAEERISHIVNVAHCVLWYAIVERDPSGKKKWDVYTSNETAAQQFFPLDITADETYGQALQRNILEVDKSTMAVVSSQALDTNQPSYTQRFRCRRKDGRIRWLKEDVRIKSIGDGKWSLVGVVTDVTSHIEIEETLQAAKGLLEDRVRERTLELAQANEAEREQRQFAEALRDTSKSLSSLLKLEEVADRIFTQVARVVPPHHIASLLLIEDQDFIRTIRYREYLNPTHHTQSTYEQHLLAKMPIINQILTTKNPITVTEVHANPMWLTFPTQLSVCSYVGAPIFAEGEIIGFLFLASTNVAQFSEQDADRLLAFTHQAGIAIENARLYEANISHTETLEHTVKERTEELEFERAQLRAIMDAMIEGVIYYDNDGHAQYINASLVELTGYGVHEWLKQANIILSGHLLPETRTELSDEIAQYLQQQGNWQGEVNMRRKNGELFDANLFATTVKSYEKEPVGTVFVLRDISQQKRLEEQKSRFIANASHELRTPITNLKTRLFLIEHQPENSEEHLNIIKAVTNWMHKLVDDLLDVSRFNHGTIDLNFQPTTVQYLIKQVVDIQQMEAEHKHIAFSVKMPAQPLRVLVDHLRIIQVITNLVSNAIKYTDSGGSIEIRVDKENDTFAVIEVEDTGHGISEETLPHVFEPFFRGSEYNVGSTGLGLNIAREIVEMHTGIITVTSELDKGTCFKLKLALITKNNQAN